MTPTLQVNGLTKNFGRLAAVKNISFSAGRGEVIALLGPNGAGKSTLMNMITGYLAPSSGTVRVMGTDIAADPMAAKTSIGFLPEGSPLYPDLSVRAFLRYMAELRKVPAARVEEVAAVAKIEPVLPQRVETLSKGYLRRVGFAQSILSDPPVLLLDEPTDGLDPNQKDHIRGLISSMGRDKTILISTHLLDEAETIATRIILMAKGQIMADGPLPQILAAAGASGLAEAFRLLTR